MRVASPLDGPSSAEYSVVVVTGNPACPSSADSKSGQGQGRRHDVIFLGPCVAAFRCSDGRRNVGS